jgi:hypothetical protein
MVSRVTAIAKVVSVQTQAQEEMLYIAVGRLSLVEGVTAGQAEEIGAERFSFGV